MAAASRAKGGPLSLPMDPTPRLPQLRGAGASGRNAGDPEEGSFGSTPLSDVVLFRIKELPEIRGLVGRTLDRCAVTRQRLGQVGAADLG